MNSTNKQWYYGTLIYYGKTMVIKRKKKLWYYTENYGIPIDKG